MKRVLVLGGKLQGLEAAYLMKKAGWHVTVMDKNPAAAAAGLADRFLQDDIMTAECLCQEMQQADLVIPALEKLPVLEYISAAASECGARLMFNLHSYNISCSKLRSDKLFQELGVPAPLPWPDCSFPIIVKPSERSGSEGVARIEDEAELSLYQQRYGSLEGQVVQQYVAGPSYSIEIVACKGRLKTFQVTELEMDAVYDCKRVICPSGLSREMEAEFAACAATLAKAVELEGIMDVEVILHEGKLKVLEIDARLPSQTLTAVYQSTGVIAPEVYGTEERQGGSVDRYTFAQAQGVIYEHVEVSDGVLRTAGEHIMGSRGPLKLIENFFGADEALTNYRPGSRTWAATLIIRAETRQQAWQKHLQVIDNIVQAENLSGFEDREPEVPVSFGSREEEAV